MAQYHYKIENDTSMLDLCQAKQNGGEIILDYTQRWIALVGFLPCIMLDTQLVHIFINNIYLKLGYHIRLNCASTFKDIMSKGPLVEQALMDEGVIKIYKEYSNKPKNDRSRY